MKFFRAIPKALDMFKVQPVLDVDIFGLKDQLEHKKLSRQKLEENLKLQEENLKRQEENTLLETTKREQLERQVQMLFSRLGFEKLPPSSNTNDGLSDQRTLVSDRQSFHDITI